MIINKRKSKNFKLTLLTLISILATSIVLTGCIAPGEESSWVLSGISSGTLNVIKEDYSQFISSLYRNLMANCSTEEEFNYSTYILAQRVKEALEPLFQFQISVKNQSVSVMEILTALNDIKERLTQPIYGL